jgi:phosphoribosylcarboxyaminoimidazole (NCAIR) mutase
MGCPNDLLTMHAAVYILQHFCIPYEVDDIVAAHRTTGQMNALRPYGIGSWLIYASLLLVLVV